MLTIKTLRLMMGFYLKIWSKEKYVYTFAKLAEHADIGEKIFLDIITFMLSKSDLVEKMVAASFLSDATKRSYWQSYQSRVKQLSKE
jgi:serine/threonine-protein kinase HipA